MRRILAVALSLRTTAVLLAALAALLLVSVAVPQVGSNPQAHAQAIRSGPVARFLLVRLGFGDVAASPPFIAVLVAFFVNLSAVLLDRLGTTLHRIRFAPPSEAQVDALLASPGALGATDAHTDAEHAAAVLRQLGYRAAAVGPRAVWGVKHRLALLGFPIFHASFFLLFAGGLELYLTRHVVTTDLVEGQERASHDGGLVRRAPLGPPPPAAVRVDRVDVRLEDGKPTDLAITLAIDGGAPMRSRVNHPAVQGPLTVIAERAGIAPVLWLTDARGFTLDRVVAPVVAPRGQETRIPLLSGEVEVFVEPIPVGSGFPVRAELPSTPLGIRVHAAGKDLFRGTLRPGETATLGERSLRVQEVRYWAGLLLVHERGGGLLVAGFVLSVLGIVWRMVMFRREIAVGWGAEGVRVAGRGEFFPARFRDELELVRELCVASRVEGRRTGSGA